MLCACLLVLFTGATGAVAETVEPDEQAEQLVLELFAAWSEHDLDRIDSIFVEDGSYEDVPPQKTYRGAEEIKGFLTAIWAWAPDIEFELASVAVAEETVVTEWVMTGTQTGPIGPIPASGNEFSVRGASVTEIREGGVARHSDYYDLSTLVVQFGVRFAAPPPKQPAE